MATAVFKSNFDGPSVNGKRSLCTQTWNETYRPSKRARHGPLNVSEETQHVRVSMDDKIVPMDWSVEDAGWNISKPSRPTSPSDSKRITTVSTWLAPR